MAENLRVASELVREAESEGAKLIALPENVALMDHRTEQIQSQATAIENHPAILAFGEVARETGAWIVAGAGLTPFPYKVITIASGVTGLSLPVFLAASIVARGLRFAIVTALLWYFGAPIRDFIERYLGLLFILFMVLLIGGFAVVKLVL